MIGTLDPTFGAGGWAAIPSHIIAGGSQGMAVDALGRTVFASSAEVDGVVVHLEVTRVNADGSPDLSFGIGGTVTLGTESAQGAAVTFDASGDVIVFDGTGTVTRLTPAGALDPTFGTGGTISLAAENFRANRGGAVVVDAAGDIVLAGDASPGGMAVLRLTPTGAPDPAFNGGVVATIPAVADGDGSYGLAIDPTGRIVVAGSGADGEWAVGRLTPGGMPDTTFAGTGSKTFAVSPGGRGSATGVAIDGAGNILLAGSDGGRAAVVRLTPAGDLDSTFGADGVLEAPDGISPDPVKPVGLILRPDGDVVVAWTVDTIPMDSTWTYGVFELTPAGTLDPTFNPAGSTPGTSVLPVGPGEWAQVVGLALTPAGDILIGGIGRPGRETDNGQNDIMLARLRGTATADQPPADPLGSLGVSVRTAVGDVNGDGFPDTIYVTGPGTPLRFAVVSGADGTTLLVPPTDPFGDNFTGGAYVAAADFDHSGRAQIVVAADVGGGPRVAIWGLSAGGQLTERASFFGITGDPSFRGGTRVAVGDVNADGTQDLVVAAGYGGGPRVAVFDGAAVLSATPTKLVADFFAFPGADAVTLRNGAFVAVGDVDGDGFGDLIFGGGPGGGPRVVVVSGKILVQGGPGAAVATPMSNFFVGGDDTTRTGVAVAVTTAAGDGVADVVAGPPPGAVPVTTTSPPSVPVYTGSALTAGTPPAPAMTIDPMTDTILAAVFVG